MKRGCIPVALGKKEIRSRGGECGRSCSVVEELTAAAGEGPYLCSQCKSHTLRSVGRPLRMFFFEELKAATNNFAFDNCLAERHVFRGVLEGGGLVAVKVVIDELAFRSQINTLDRINSPLIIGLIGFCDHEHNMKLLVYDFICNGSLDWHLTSSTLNVMPWATRKAIATSIGKGVRCMHTGSSLGSIQHQDLRSRHIFLTHDFTPIIGGMSYAKWKSIEKDTQLLPVPSPPPRIGYSAPEHIEGAQELTEKADIYSYGVILLELITGRKASDPCRDLGEQILTEWACPLLEKFHYEKLIDPNLGHQFNHYELSNMMRAAAQCLKKDVTSRPSISTVLGILEDGGDKVGAAFDSDSEKENEDLDSDGHSSVSVPLSPSCHIVDRRVRLVDHPTLHRSSRIPGRMYRSRPKLSYNDMMLQ